ncbi:uncharacterized protein LOC110841761 [Folsomia candida]|uniref:uncharacterized protein LOC110841761 n=1 Tax=Folsomia candida TaxID=158441 RepID=UPI0016051277|nr:uncharacterized protein LOC110841761 [Folsomia candida]
MEEYIIGAIIIIITLIFGWISIKTKILDNQCKITVSSQCTERDITLARINLQEAIHKNNTQETVAILQDKTKRERIISKHDLKGREIVLESQGQNAILERERLQQAGITNRTQIKTQAFTNVANMDLTFRYRELDYDKQKFNAMLDFNGAVLQHQDQWNERDLSIKRELGLEQGRTHRYLADRRQDAIEFSQRAESARHLTSMNTYKDVTLTQLKSAEKMTKRTLETEMAMQDRSLNWEKERFEAQHELNGRMLELNDNWTNRSLDISKMAIENQAEMHSLEMDTCRGLGLASLSVNRDLGMASIQSNERIEFGGFDCRRDEAREATKQAESNSNFLQDVLGTTLTVLTGGLFSKGNGGNGGGMRALPSPGSSSRRAIVQPNF